MIKRKLGKCAILMAMAVQAVYACFLSYGAIGESVSNRLENDRQVLSAAGQCLREGSREGEFFVTGRNYVPEGTILGSFYGDSLEYSNTIEEISNENDSIYYKTRFAVSWRDEKEEILENPKEAGEEKRYWSLGDRVIREINGQRYTFCCIDQNYKTQSTSSQTAALFLCDTVIPADVGSHYEYEKQKDGSYKYVFYPGPVVNFGDSSEYKYSKIRQWLKAWEDQVAGAVWTDIGVANSYTGQTETGSYSQFQDKELHSHYIGNQQMTDRLFILSVDEALAYREALWRFETTPVESPFCKGYWLRNPVGNDTYEEDGMVYIVDLINGTIRPEKIKPNEEYEGGDGEEQLDEQTKQWMVTSSIGIRPAFALPQQG